MIKLRARKRAIPFVAATAALCIGFSGVAAAAGYGWWAAHPHDFTVQNDTLAPGKGGVIKGNVLKNDHGATGIVRTSALDNPAAGALSVGPDGTTTFTP